MEYTKAELIEMRNALSEQIAALVAAQRWTRANELAQIRDKVQRDIEMRK